MACLMVCRKPLPCISDWRVPSHAVAGCGCKVCLTWPPSPEVESLRTRGCCRYPEAMRVPANEWGGKFSLAWELLQRDDDAGGQSVR